MQGVSFVSSKPLLIQQVTADDAQQHYIALTVLHPIAALVLVCTYSLPDTVMLRQVVCMYNLSIHILWPRACMQILANLTVWAADVFQIYSQIYKATPLLLLNTKRVACCVTCTTN